MTCSVVLFYCIVVVVSIDPPVEIEVVRAFLSNPEQEEFFSSIDDRYDTHNLGLAMLIKYKDGTQPPLTSAHLVQVTIEQCSSIFESYSYKISIIMYEMEVYVSMNDIFDLDVEPVELLQSTGMTFDDFDKYMESRQLAALGMSLKVQWAR